MAFLCCLGAYDAGYDSTSDSSISIHNLRLENEYVQKRIKCIRKILLMNEVNKWKRTQLNTHKEMRRRQLVKAFLLHQFLRKKEKKEKQSKLWVRSIFTEERRCYQ